MRTLCLVLTFCLLSVVSWAVDLSWNTLASRQDLWPAQCTMKVPIQFQGNVNVKVGDRVNVMQFNANEVQVSTLDGQTNFTAAPQEIDCLEQAQKQYDTLTPKQQALSYASLVQRKDLWPAEVTLNKGFNFGSGHQIAKGDQVKVQDVQNGFLIVVSENTKTTFKVPPSATNIMAQSWGFVENEQGGPRFLAEQNAEAEKQKAAEKDFNENRLIYELKGKLINVATDQQQPLNSNAMPHYFVFMRGSSTCPITHKFIPELVNFYNQARPKHPEFEIVYIMYDTLGDASKFSQQQGFSSWRALAYDNTPRTPNAVIDGRLPQLFVMDRSGKLLINGIQYDAPKALEQLEALLNKS